MVCVSPLNHCCKNTRQRVHSVSGTRLLHFLQYACVSCKDPFVHFNRNFLIPLPRHQVEEILLYDGPNLEEVL